MNDNPNANAESNVSFQKLLSIGLGVWFLTQISLLVAGLVGDPHKSLINSVDGAIGYSWIGFLAGLLAMLAMAFRLPGGRRRALIAYLLPFALFAVVGAIFYKIHPDRMFLTEILGILPLVWLFGVLGLVWLRLRTMKSGNEALMCALLPPLIGGLAILIGLGVTTFRSNDFIYNHAFNFDIGKTTFADGKLEIDAVLVIRKPGDYEFRALKYSHMDIMNTDDTGIDHMIGRMEWTGGRAPKKEEIGSFPLKIRWDKSSPPSTADEDPMVEDCIVVDVFKGDEMETAIKTLSVPLRAN